MRISDWSSDVCSSDLLQDERPRYVVPREVHQHLMVRFAEALRSGSMATLKSLLADDAVLIGDGGGIVTSFPKPLVGGWRIAKLFFAGFRRYGAAQRIELAQIGRASCRERVCQYV